ncbi:MAG: hypothetical protein MUC49_15595 [Raineya sp.]|jgi:hypothetical protein|nr:hypothetical protein [Raineya sp.]
MGEQTKLVNPAELKTVISISYHFPNVKRNSIGVTPKIVYEYIKSGKLNIERVDIDGRTFFVIPMEDQEKPDWGLGEKIKY